MATEHGLKTNEIRLLGGTGRMVAWSELPDLLEESSWCDR